MDLVPSSQDQWGADMSTCSLASPRVGAVLGRLKAAPLERRILPSPCMVTNSSVSLSADVLRFDNTYSYLHAKKVSYTVEVLLPDKKSEEQIEQLGEKINEVALNNA